MWRTWPAPIPAAQASSAVGDVEASQAAQEGRGRAGSQGTGFLDGRFNASSTIPVHGAGPWVIDPPDTTPDGAGDPSRVVFCLDGPSE